jgi:hypothetical protein
MFIIIFSNHKRYRVIFYLLNIIVFKILSNIIDTYHYQIVLVQDENKTAAKEN